MTTGNKNEFGLSLALVIGLLIAVFAIYGFVLLMAKDGYGLNMARVQGDQTAVAERIKPVVSLEDLMSGGDKKASAAAAPVAMKSPEELFNGVCAACHSTGVAGAPKLGDTAAWEPRYARGLDALFASATQGKGAMPPRGGSSYSDDEIKSIIRFMLGKAGLLDASAPAAAPAEAQPAAAASAPAEKAAPAADMTEDMMPQGGSEKPEMVADLAAGEKAYRSACFACHDAGVAGAPRLGDAAAWSPRLAKGVEALLGSVKNGKGAMPPRGGTTLSDDQLRNVIAFIASKAQ